MAIKRKDTIEYEIDKMPMYLNEMSLSQCARKLIEQLEDPNIGLKSAEERIIDITMAEYNTRYAKKIAKGIEDAKLKFPEADMADYRSDPERKINEEILFKLSECSFIDQKKNVIVSGPCGTGKTWLVCALAIKAITQFRSVRFFSTSKLIMEMKTKDEKTYLKFLDQLAKKDLVILDDVGLMSLDYNSCRIFFDILESRYENGSTIYISQYPVNEWYGIFENATYADASLSRIINKSYRLEVSGKDFRKDNS